MRGGQGLVEASRGSLLRRSPVEAVSLVRVPFEAACFGKGEGAAASGGDGEELPHVVVRKGREYLPLWQLTRSRDL